METSTMELFSKHRHLLSLVLFALTWTQVNSATVECSQFTPSFCFIDKELPADGNVDLTFTSKYPPSVVSHFNIIPPAQLKHFPKSIFATFTELRDVEAKIGLESLSQNDFENANHLTNLILRLNRLTVIETSTFTFADQLDRLDLSENEIREIQGGAFSGLGKLKTLKLHTNQISTLKENALSDLVSLEYLFLHKNQIESIESGAFNLPALVELFVSNNKLTVLSDDLFSRAPRLELVIISENELTKIGEAFSNCQSLSYINLENNNQLNDPNLLKFAKLPALRLLSLNNTGLSEIEDTSEAAAPTNSALESLSLSYNHFTSPSIFRHLSIFRELKHLYLDNNRGLKNITTIEHARRYLPKLKTLALD